jgi:hypothetical protein
LSDVILQASIIFSGLKNMTTSKQEEEQEEHKENHGKSASGNLERSSSIPDIDTSCGSSMERILQYLVVTPPTNAANAGLNSPDYTFIAKDLRAIISDTDINGRASLDDARPYAFSPDDLKRLIQLKNLTRNIDARVLVGGFQNLMGQLESERINEVGTFPRRIQVAYKRDDKDLNGNDYEHWTAIDIFLTLEGIKVFYFDFSGDPTNFELIINAVGKFPLIELTVCEDIEIDGKSLAIQKDGESCSIFTIDSIFHMSKLENLHKHIEENRIKEPGGKLLYSLDPRKLPAVLVRNAQSASFMLSWMELNSDKFNDKVDKKGRNILEYVESNSVFYPKIRKHINSGVQAKQLKYTDRLEM